MKKIKKSPIEYILFDMDGTIVDTELTAALAVQRVFAEWNIQVDPNDANYITGRTWESAFQFLFKKYPIPVSFETAGEACLNRYREALHDDLKVVPGSIAAIQSLAQRFPLGLVSGSGRKEILWILKKLGVESQFRVILGAEDYSRSKPHPDGYQKALNFFKAEPKNCLVFEDSVAGINSALSAGLWVVAITSTNHFKQKIEGAHFEIQDLTVVTENWIEQLPFG
jgi:hypothetical protein